MEQGSLTDECSTSPTSWQYEIARKTELRRFIRPCCIGDISHDVGLRGSINDFHDKYCITKRIIGKGGFGTVYAGLTLCDQRPVAIKRIRSCNLAFTEHYHGRKLPTEVVFHMHVNDVKGVLRLLDHYVLPDDSHALVIARPTMAVDLHAYKARHGPLDENTARNFLSQVLRTVIYCRDAGICHRDIKDENLIIDVKTGRVYLIDFGSSALWASTYENYITGTSVYCPPEWFRNRSYRPDAGTVWSLGILLYNFLYCDVPFKTSSQIVNDDPTWPDTAQHISESAKSFIKSCLNKNADLRPSFHELQRHYWLNVLQKPWDMMNIRFRDIHCSRQNLAVY